MNSRILAALFTLLLVAASHAQTVFTLNKASYLPGEAITATWSGRTSPAAKDWIGVYPRTSSPGGPVSTLWNYTSGTRTAGTPLQAGSITFTNPGLAIGQWSAYFLSNDSYNSLGRVDFVVAPAPTQVVMNLNKASYATGEAITATWSNRTPANANDKIAVFPRNAATTTTPTLWVHSSGTQTPGSALESGSVTFSSPGLAIGDWTMHFLDSDGTTSRANVNFSVTAALPSFTLNKSVYQLNEPIKVTWSGRTAPSTTDWVGVYPTSMSGVPDGSPGSTIWSYMNGTQTATTALSSGTFTFAAPGLPKGNWTAYFLANDGYQILGSVQFTVANSPRILGFTADHAFINDGTPITLSWVIDPGDGAIETLVVRDGTNETDVHTASVLDVSPEQNTTYTLVLNGTITAEARVFKESGNTAAFSIGATHLATGSPLTTTWNGVTGNSDSWIAVFRAGQQPRIDQAPYWNYLNGTRTAGGNLIDGAMSFNLPAGEYYVVLFTNGGYTIEQGPIRFTVHPDAIQPLAVTNFGQDNGDMRLDWNSLPGVSYDVQTSTDMIHWNSEAEGIRARGTASSLFIAPTPGDASRFWRIRQNP
ncbi:MAG: hypothetical protein EOP88_07255 [Verrucomicrobiaceae bacterium]|nr:MAG: hypothetical protein EOP88_07255 [Verrucomicrobiaceae bacterium]